jgi:hypothetical protein
LSPHWSRRRRTMPMASLRSPTTMGSVVHNFSRGSRAACG